MWSFLRRRTLTQWIVVAMVAGVAIGVMFPAFAVSLLPISTAFIRIIKSIIVPLIFGTLVVGIAGHGDDMKRVGRLALKSIVYFEIVTTLALFIGLLTVNVMKPGWVPPSRLPQPAPRRWPVSPSRSPASSNTSCRRVSSTRRRATKCCRSCFGRSSLRSA